jgi:hypothetical protein
MAIRQGDVVSNYEICQAERRNLQQGMNFRPAREAAAWAKLAARDWSDYVANGATRR